ncbi:MAG TPA: hypothetical protein VKB58_12180 [Terriglobales bacterium]|nr:hypothetical protein [Terriglobales bacterium]
MMPSRPKMEERAQAPPHIVLRLPSPVATHGWFARFFSHSTLARVSHRPERTYPWYLVMWLTGVDYFSTLGYQPGIALLAAGALAVPATAVLVAVTLLGAVPIYTAVAERSYAGQGSIALIENLFSGWTSKILVLVLLGFAATDFVITMTLSAADAARHAIANPYLHPFAGSSRMRVTLLLLLLLAIVFLIGFREAIRVASYVAVPYLFLNLIVLLWCVGKILFHLELLSNWHAALAVHGDWTMLFVASALIFPKLALGLSGFETGVSVMPLVNGADPGKTEETIPGRIRSTRKLLLSAAGIMSVMLLLSSFVAVVLIPESAYRQGGPADGRAIAYLAHMYLGTAFGTVYDISTILILWFAGASAMAGLLNLIPRYLPRYGMAPHWVAYHRPLVLVLLVIDVLVTLVFRASVTAQGGAYATGVLVLMLSAAVAVTISLWREAGLHQPRKYLQSFYYLLVSLVFVYTVIANVIERPDGAIIASIFIFLLLSISALSRAMRSTEMRVSEATFTDAASAALWERLKGKKVNLIPHRINTPDNRKYLSGKVRQHYEVKGPLAYLHVTLMDNRSDFLSPLRLKLVSEGQDFVIEASGAVAVANSVAYISELLDPISIVLGLTGRPLMRQSLEYLLFGEGETGLLVYSILVRYWESIKRVSGLPIILMVSESSYRLLEGTDANSASQ